MWYSRQTYMRLLRGTRETRETQGLLRPTKGFEGQAYLDRRKSPPWRIINSSEFPEIGPEPRQTGFGGRIWSGLQCCSRHPHPHSHHLRAPVDARQVAFGAHVVKEDDVACPEGAMVLTRRRREAARTEWQCALFEVRKIGGVDEEAGVYLSMINTRCFHWCAARSGNARSVVDSPVQPRARQAARLAKLIFKAIVMRS